MTEPLDLSLKTTKIDHVQKTASKIISDSVFYQESVSNTLNGRQISNHVPNETALSLPWISREKSISSSPVHNYKNVDSPYLFMQEKSETVICCPDIMWFIDSRSSLPESEYLDENSCFQEPDKNEIQIQKMENVTVLEQLLGYKKVSKQYQCTSTGCDKAYNSAAVLKRHLATHTLPHNCKICGKSFSKASNLKVHIQVHISEKPFSCLHCHKHFANKRNLNRHMETHAPIKIRYQCPECSTSFARRDSIKKHERKCCSGKRKKL